MKKILISLSLIAFALVGCNDISSNKPHNTLNIIGGSELKQIEPIIQQAEKATGIKINIKYSGTIEGFETVKTNNVYDVAWFGNSKYLYDSPESMKLVKLSEKVMFSPVIVGVKKESYQKNNLSSQKNYSWKDIANLVINKNMTFAMTDPSVSNTGYVSLMGVVYSFANKGENVKIQDVNEATLRKFFNGQKLTAKSSNWLMDQFNSNPNIDFVVNYEAAILNQPDLIPVYPHEGIVTADYPLILLKSEKTEAFKTFVNYLKQNNIQEQLVKSYKYRSISQNVMSNQTVFDNSQLLIEMPFNPDAYLAEKIVDSYFQTYKKPARFAFVVDTSGSMGGNRERMMKDAVAQLVQGNISKYASIREREQILVVPFSEKVYGIQNFTYTNQKDLNNYVQGLQMNGGTAMFDATATAISQLKSEMSRNKDYRYSVIVLTDGVSNNGANYEEFAQWYRQQNIEQGDIRVFAISFGDADMKQLSQLTKLTGGNVFDGKSSLATAFREIRSYQ